MKNLLITTLIITLFLTVGCRAPKAEGTLHGTVVRASGAVVPYPSVIIARQHSSPLVPPQIGSGDQHGEFSVTVGGGNYILQIASSADGPYYTWPETVYVIPSITIEVRFLLPDGY